MSFTPNLLDSESMRLIEARNHQSNTLIEAAQKLLRQSSEIDLSNVSTRILHRYPEAHTVVFLEDQRTYSKGVIFCGHINGADGKKLGDSFEAKKFVEALLLEYGFADQQFIVDRLVNLREYAAKQPSWFA